MEQPRGEIERGEANQAHETFKLIGKSEEMNNTRKMEKRLCEQPQVAEKQLN